MMRSAADGSPFPTGRRTWLDPVWLVEAREWVVAVLDGAGRSITGDPDQRHVTPWSTAIRFETDRGAVWFKASGPGLAHEGPLLRALHELRTAHILPPLAIHPERPWLLFEDGGATFRAARPDGTGDHDFVTWERILRSYASVQRSVEDPAANQAMLAAGTPDARAGHLIDELRRLVADDVIWARIPANEADEARLARSWLDAALAEGAIEAMFAAVTDSGIQPSVEHGDLHDNNILVGPAGDRFFDWGDASVAHPFATLTATFNSIAYHTGRKLDDPIFIRLRDVYTEAWTDVVPRSTLIEHATIARRLGCIGKSLAWERSLAALGPDEMDGHGDAVAGWLVDLVAAVRADPTGWLN